MATSPIRKNNIFLCKDGMYLIKIDKVKKDHYQCSTKNLIGTWWIPHDSYYPVSALVNALNTGYAVKYNKTMKVLYGEQITKTK